MTPPQAMPRHTWRLAVVIALLFLVGTALISRLVDLSVLDRHFLQNQWSQRAVRDIVLPAYRGMITDRNGEPLAISTPVYALWTNPQKLTLTPTQLTNLSLLLALPPAIIQHQLLKFKQKQFIYLKRDIPPDIAQQIKNLKLNGIFLEREYRRFYPQGESTAPLIGFTNIDDQGQAGLELEYNHWLAGKSGLKKIIQDRYGNAVVNLGVLQEPESGHDLVLSIDNRLQYLAYHALTQGLKNFAADSGAVVILDAQTGEILAMASAPSFNPNIRPTKMTDNYSNHSVADIFEPGSTMKTFAMATALSTGKYHPNTLINTNPGYWMVNNKKIDDDNVNNGIISLTRVLQVSSNVGISKIILSLPSPSDLFIHMIKSVGFTKPTGINFPGENDGMIDPNATISPFVLATMSFGYSISVNLLQLAHAYSIIAHNGFDTPVSLFKVGNNNTASPPQAMSPVVATELRTMLESVLEKGGTGVNAQVPNYIITGKTGTTRIAGSHGYENNHHNALFVGIAPASAPRLVIAVMIHNPTQHGYFGGVVAGPIFAKIMGDSLRILNVSPDNLTQS